MTDAARAAVRAGVPLILVGPPGCGKSSWAASSDRPTVQVGLPGKLPEDLAGYVVGAPDMTCARMLPPWWYGRLGDGSVLVLDDLQAADVSLLGGLLEILCGGRVGDTSLPPGTTVILTTNDTTCLPDALINRSAIVDCHAAVSAVGDWPEPPPRREDPDPQRLAAECAYIRQYLRSVGSDSPPGAHGQVLTARSADLAARMIAVGGPVLDSVAAVAGAGHAMAYAQWRRAADLPDPGDVMAGRAPWPDDAVSAHATAAAMVSGHVIVAADVVAAWDALLLAPDPVAMSVAAALVRRGRALGVDPTAAAEERYGRYL